MRELVSCFGILVGAYTKEMDYLQKSLEGVNDKSSVSHQLRVLL